MNVDPTQKFSFNMEDDIGQLIVKGEIIGESEIPFLDDLKFKAVIALLNAVDKQNFTILGNNHLFEHYIKEIEETINEVKKHNQFLGEIKL